MTREELIENIDRSWNAWLDALDGIPAGRTGEPGVCGDYSVKDLIGHIAFWDEQDLARAQKLARGEDVQPNDWQSMNDREFEAHKDDTLAQQTERMHASHARLVADTLVLDRIDALKLDETWPHYDEHRNEVLAWRNAQGV
ncbi:MAG: ClbS/DfsB family four-helix bundle protein [Thermomicrobiales bacterium]|nr:ClbS/DfsB family four-helix bundle protein [Thermomicrobiales bacterium]MCO5222867.1 maleylpyruvate isomerase N-terminal domain-containing protein [Thermomicrobiales bacterium]